MQQAMRKKIISTIFCIVAGFFCAAQNCKGSLLFDDSNPAVNLPLSSQWYSGANGGYTWECWFKLNQPFTANIRPLISCIDAVVFEDMYLGFGWDGGWFDEVSTRLVFKVDGPNSMAPSGPNCSYEPVGGFRLGVWYHAAGVMDYTTQTAKLFVNGQLVDTKPVSAPPNTRTIAGADLSGGWTGALKSVYGNMDEVRIWNRALSDAEIAANYDKCNAGNEPNLVLYYRCNEVSAAAVSDLTINNNTGIFSAAPGWSEDDAPLTESSCYSECPCPPTAYVVLAPNVFTPNGDGRNDVFCLDSAIVKKLDCHIYNRWGIEVGTIADPAGFWNGKAKNGSDCTAGVYYYVLTGENKCGDVLDQKGFVELIR